MWYDARISTRVWSRTDQPTRGPRAAILPDEALSSGIVVGLFVVTTRPARKLDCLRRSGLHHLPSTRRGLHHVLKRSTPQNIVIAAPPRVPPRRIIRWPAATGIRLAYEPLIMFPNLLTPPHFWTPGASSSRRTMNGWRADTNVPSCYRHSGQIFRLHAAVAVTGVCPQPGLFQHSSMRKSLQRCIASFVSGLEGARIPTANRERRQGALSLFALLYLSGNFARALRSNSPVAPLGGLWAPVRDEENTSPLLTEAQKRHDAPQPFDPADRRTALVALVVTSYVRPISNV